MDAAQRIDSRRCGGDPRGLHRRGRPRGICRLAGSPPVIDARGGIIMPGLVNTHTHAAMTCFRGLADDLPLMTWLNDHIFPAEAQLDAGHGVPRGAAGLRRDDPFGHHVLLRHVPVRRGRGPRRPGAPACGPWWARCSSISPPPTTVPWSRGSPPPEPLIDTWRRRPADHRRRGAALALSLRARNFSPAPRLADGTDSRW